MDARRACVEILLGATVDCRSWELGPDKKICTGAARTVYAVQILFRSGVFNRVGVNTPHHTSVATLDLGISSPQKETDCPSFLLKVHSSLLSYHTSSIVLPSLSMDRYAAQGSVAITDLRDTTPKGVSPQTSCQEHCDSSI